MYCISVPATTANLGSGFDSIGLAFKLYNRLSVCEQEQGLTITIKNQKVYLPETDERNMIYRTFCRFYQEIGKDVPKGLRFVQDDFIPPASGLGSSAACIVAGLMAANAISGANLDRNAIAELAAQLEGHPDNSTAAIFGGLTVGAFDGKRLEFIKLDAPVLDELTFAVILPKFTLPTATSRGVLPGSYTREDAVYNISRAGLLVAAFASGDLAKLKTAMRDRIHQPYRVPLIPGMEFILGSCEKSGALSAFLSGAGPALIAVLYRKDAALFRQRLSDCNISGDWSVSFLEPDSVGAEIEEIQ